MNEINDGGPAFPEVPGDRNGYEGKSGMTLRDYFAAKAMPMAFDYVRRIDADGTPDGESESEHRLKTYDFDWPTPDEGISGDELYVAQLCYQMADAMLRARGA